jgi:hypothetical protein
MPDALFRISKLCVDPSENHLPAAVSYLPVGHVLGKAQAEAVVAMGGERRGTGWPIPSNESMPVYRMTPVAAFNETPEYAQAVLEACAERLGNPPLEQMPQKIAALQESHQRAQDQLLRATTLLATIRHYLDPDTPGYTEIDQFLD